MANDKTPDLVEAINADVGGDGDVGGIAQTITADDIRAVLHSTDTVDKRAETLQTMRSDLQARLNADRGTEMGPLIEEIDNALDQIRSAGGESGTRSALKTS